MALLPLLQATALVGAALGVTARGPGTETLRAAPAIGCLQGAEAGQERGQASGRIERLVGAMGTGLSIEVEAGTRGVALRASEAAIREVEATEARLSTWRSTSELSRLQDAQGAWGALSPATLEDLSAALRWSRATSGRFDPCLGRLVEAWDLRGSGRQPSAELLAAARAASGCGLLELDLEGGRGRLLGGARFDAGGYGKGAALDRALRAAVAGGATRVHLDLGGQHAFAGDGTWSLELAHPRERHQPVLRLTVVAGSVATSGNSERRWSAGGRTFGHLLDPGTGAPLEADAHGHTATVVAPRALAADALSTAAFVDPAAAGAALSEAEAHLLLLRLEGDTVVAEVAAGFPYPLTPLVPSVVVRRGSGTAIR
ncbi:MAG: FAD:protein FMN transferase [Planctomycetota bacterium]|nr:FAD:protein FMN transferase [Planctomycetota bacterium]